MKIKPYPKEAHTKSGLLIFGQYQRLKLSDKEMETLIKKNPKLL